MRQTLHTFICVILAAAMLFSVSGCNKEEKEIEKLLVEFEYGCNSLDIMAIIDCIDPAISDKIKIGAELLGHVAGQDAEELFDICIYYLMNDSTGFLGELGGSVVDFFAGAEITIEEIVVEEDYGVVYTIISSRLLNQDIRRKAEFDLIYYIDQWYISGFQLV